MTSSRKPREYAVFQRLEEVDGCCEAVFSICNGHQTTTADGALAGAFSGSRAVPAEFRLDMAFIACWSFDRHEVRSGLSGSLEIAFNVLPKVYEVWWSGPRIALLVRSLTEQPRSFMEIKSKLRELIAIPEADLQRMLKSKGIDASGYEGQFISGNLSGLLTRYTGRGLPCAANDEYYKSPETHNYMQLLGAAWMESGTNPLRDAYRQWVATREKVDSPAFQNNTPMVA